MMAKFAANTSVPVAQTKGDIAAIIGKYNGALLNINETSGRAELMFRSNQVPPRHLRVLLHLPTDPEDEQVCRRKWRALLIDIKAKFVAVDDGIETFDQAFMAWIIAADGKTLFEKAQQLHLLEARA
jgi:hypothetical protein